MLLDYAKNNELFANLTDIEIKKILRCTEAAICEYKKKNIICSYNELKHKIGIVIDGCVTIARIDESGTHFIIANVKENGLFGLSLALSKYNYDDIYIYASTDCKALIMDSNTIMQACDENCHCHIKLLKNLVLTIATKNTLLIRKQCHMCCKSLRKKITSFLMEQLTINNSSEFTILMNRQELADYLGVDRSALSAELSKMQKEGLITYNHNKFSIINITYSKDIFKTN